MSGPGGAQQAATAVATAAASQALSLGATAAGYLFNQASAFVPRSTSLFSSYTISPPGSSPPIQIGLWKVERAVHTASGKAVSVWTVEKSHLTPAPGGGRASASKASGERALEVLKKEVSSLSRLRHPCVLEMAEPMEESRSSLSFATEPVTSSLLQAINASGSSSSASASSYSSSSRRASHTPSSGQSHNAELELDEVEIQKGMSQLGKGLQFLHESAKLVHGNLTAEAVVINSKGDWKLGGFGLSTYMFDKDGVPAKWEFSQFDHSIPISCQRNYDYIAPEYILDESPPAPSNDLYALGCLLHQIHVRTGPPFANHNSLATTRTNLENSLTHSLLLPSWRKLPSETQSVLSQLLTRYPSARLSATNFLNHSYFNNILVSTLRFLERDSFASQSSEAQAGFLRGLVGVLPRFSEKVQRKKVLPGLLEETRKSGLVPFLLPCIVAISKDMDTDTFRSDVLPNLKPLFAIKDPPQAVLSLLDNLSIMVEKCTPTVFREEVMPLIYGALESDNPVILERALKVVPGLSQTLDYTTVKQSLFPKVTTVFSKTTMLSVKVNTLICFHSMIPTLDKFTLTEKLVPLLSKIKTKEPSVMIATLAVHEEMGKKCEVESIATLILPHLWQMSMAPLLNLNQFNKFMKAIKTLSQRVEEEHGNHLSELKRLEESSNNQQAKGGEIDFESLVRGNAQIQSAAPSTSAYNPSSPFASPPLQSYTPSASFSSPPLPATPYNPATLPIPSYTNGNTSSSSKLGAKPLPSTAFDMSSFNNNVPSVQPLAPPPAPFAPPPSTSSYPSYTNPTPSKPAPPSGLGSFAALQPSRPQPNSISSTPSLQPARPSTTTSSSYSGGRPNYNISLSSTPVSPPQQHQQPLSYAPSYTQPQSPPQPQANPAIKWNVVPPPGFASGAAVLQPTIVKKTAPGFGDWGDLDPLG